MRFAISSLFLALALTACAQGPSGSWKSSREVSDAFAQAQVFPNHQYYYVGSVERPDGVIAIDPRFHLRDGNVWAKIEVDAQRLRDWYHMWQTETTRNCHYRGGVILTPTGERAGYWYSPFLYNQVRLDENGTLIVNQPRDIDGSTDCERENLRDSHDVWEP